MRGAATISRVETFVISPAFRQAFVLGSGPVGGSARTGHVVFVKVTTQDGVAGWGEQRALPSWSYETWESIASTINQYLAPLLIGTSPFEIDAFHSRARHVLSPSVSNGFPFARAAVDVALHDLAGKLAEIPVSALLGGARTAELALCSAIGVGTADFVRSRAEEAAEYAAYKVKIGGDVDRDEAAIRTVAASVGEKDIWLDANQSYRPSRLRQLVARVNDIPSIYCVEQPVASTDWAGMRRCRDLLGIPVAIDEGAFSARDFARAALLEAADLAVVKVCKAGGLREAERAIAVASAHGMEVLASGLTDCGVAFAAAVHLFSTVDLALPAELNGPELLRELYVDGLQLSHGQVTVPTGPGLGIEVDEERIRQEAHAALSCTDEQGAIT